MENAYQMPEWIYEQVKRFVIGQMRKPAAVWKV